jgi:hypothetical protein
MTDDDRPPVRPPATQIYTIRVRGHVGPRLTDRLDGLRPRHEPDGTTTLTGPFADQAALHGLLRRIRDLGLPLLSVAQLGPEEEALRAMNHDDPSGTEPS